MNTRRLEIFDEVKNPYPQHKGIDNEEKILSPDEKAIFQFYVAEFDLYERVWFLKEEKEKLSEYEWICWIIYLESMSHHWLFRYSFNQTRTIFDKGFMNYIKEKIIDRQDEGENSREKLEEDARVEYMKEYKKKLILPDKVVY